MIVVASAVYMGARVVMSVVCAATARCVDVNTVISFALYPAVLPETFDAGVTQGRETGGSRETSMTNCNKASQHAGKAQWTGEVADRQQAARCREWLNALPKAQRPVCDGVLGECIVPDPPP